MAIISISILNGGTINEKALALLLTLCLSLTLGLSTAKQVQASETAISGSVPDIVSTTPKTPVVKLYKANTKSISGTGLYGTKVYVKYNDKNYTATVNSNGNWKVTTPKLKKGIKASVYLKNSAGTVSKTKTVTIK